MKQLIIATVAFFAAANLSAQDEFDVLRYSMNPYQGTARGMGLGSAMGSLGADFTSLSVNPAGIGLYRRGELSFSPSFTVSDNKGTYQGEVSSNNVSKLNLSQVGLVLTQAKKGNAYTRSGWKAASFAFGVNRVATFRNDYSYQGNNNRSSFIERYAEEFNRLGGFNASTLGGVSYPAYGAWYTYLVDRNYFGDSTQALSYVPYGDGLKQRKDVTERGGMHEYVISGGGNYMEKLMLGATLCITRSNYSRTLQFSEEDLSGNTSNDFRYARFTERLTTEGTGFNFKLGAIFKPVEAFRLGLALHAPSGIFMNDTYSVGMESHTDSLKLRNNPGADPVTAYTQDTLQIFNYSMSTPYKAIASATVLFQQYGFLTADVEYVDYRTMKYDYGIGYESENNAVNEVIRRTYTNAVNIRVGAEAKLNDFAIRAGYAMYGSPFASQANAYRTLLSGGVGYRAKNWFLDIGFIHSSQQQTEQPYTLSRVGADVPVATLQQNRSQLVMTMGRRL